MSNLTVFDQETANNLFSSNEPFPIKFDDAWKWLEYSRKDAGLESFLACGFSESIDFIRFQEKVKSGVVERELSFYSLTIDCFKSWAMLSKTQTGKQVRLYFLECERIAKANPVRKTRRQLAEEYLAMEIELEEKEAEIKLLNTHVDVLAEIVDDLYRYSSIIRVAKFNGVSEKSFSWHKLKAASTTLDLEIKTAPCPRYNTKNLYAHEAWEFVYPEMNLPEPTTLVLG
ncbi:MAG: hypothetical protein ACRDBG_11025 [Waterburya sp.]